MEEFCILILVLFFATNSLHKAESVKVKLEETPLKTFDEIFGEGWWDKDEAEDLKMPAPTNFRQNFHHQIDGQNTQLGQIEPNSTDQNSPHTKSDHSDNAKNGEEQNEITSNAEEERKRKIVDNFHAIKDEFKQKAERFSAKEWTQIERKIAEHLKVNRKKIYKWKKEFGKTGPKYSDDEKLKIVKMLMRMKSERSGEDKKSCKEMDKEIAERFHVNVGTINRWKNEFGLSRRNPKNERKNLVEKFDQKKAELKRAGFKSSYKNELDETVAKELGISDTTIYAWKRELSQTTPKHKQHSYNEQKELMKHYYEIKDKTPNISVKKCS